MWLAQLSQGAYVCGLLDGRHAAPTVPLTTLHATRPTVDGRISAPPGICKTHVNTTIYYLSSG